MRGFKFETQQPLVPTRHHILVRREWNSIKAIWDAIHNHDGKCVIIMHTREKSKYGVLKYCSAVFHKTCVSGSMAILLACTADSFGQAYYQIYKKFPFIQNFEFLKKKIGTTALYSKNRLWSLQISVSHDWRKRPKIKPVVVQKRNPDNKRKKGMSISNRWQ